MDRELRRWMVRAQKLIDKQQRRQQWRAEQAQKQLQKPPKSERPLCGAKTRAGGTCKARALAYADRCRMHGGLSTGPTTEAGRQRIVESNRRRGMLRRGMTPEEIATTFEAEAEERRAAERAAKERENAPLYAEMLRRVRAYEAEHGPVTASTVAAVNDGKQWSKRESIAHLKRILIEAGKLEK